MYDHIAGWFPYSRGDRQGDPTRARAPAPVLGQLDAQDLDFAPGAIEARAQATALRLDGLLQHQGLLPEGLLATILRTSTHNPTAFIRRSDDISPVCLCVCIAVCCVDQGP